MGLPARNYGACGSPQSKPVAPPPPWPPPTPARKKTLTAASSQGCQTEPPRPPRRPAPPTQGFGRLPPPRGLGWLTTLPRTGPGWSERVEGEETCSLCSTTALGLGNAKPEEVRPPGARERGEIWSPKERVSLHPTTLYQKHFAKGTRGQERRKRRGEGKREGRRDREASSGACGSWGVPPSPPAWMLTHFS